MAESPWGKGVAPIMASLTASIIRGTAGDDNLTGTGSNDTFALWQGGSDTVDAGGGNDVFRMGAALDAGDKLDGGTGRDYVLLNGDYSAGVVFNADTITNIEVIALGAGHSYKLTTNDGNVAAGEGLLVKAGALGSGDTLTFDGSAEADGKFYIIAGAGNDVLTGGAKHDVFDLTKGGNDTAHGGGGYDTFNLGAAFTAADTIDGGAGINTLSFDGTYASLALSTANVISIETLTFTGGNTYSGVTVTGDIASGNTLNIDASAAGSIALNLSAATSTAYVVTGSAGGDTITGNNTGTTYHLEAGGVDSLTGGAGNDAIYMGASLTASDTINGGGGRGDTLILDGDYSAGVVLNATTVTNVEHFMFAAGHDYKITIDAATLSDNTTVDGSSLGATDSLTFDASATATTQILTITGGAGDDVLTTGSHTINTFDITQGGDDTITCAGPRNTINAGAAFDAGDTIITGTGRATLNLDGDYSAGMTLNNISGSVNFAMATGNSYNFTLGAGVVAAGVSGGDSSHSLFLDASLASGKISVLDSFGSSTITGGSGNDSFTILAPAAGANILHGGGGNDTFQLNGLIGADDVIDGGTGSDTLTIAFNSTISDSNITHIDTLDLGHDLAIIGDITGGEGTLTIDFIFDGTVDLSGATTTSIVLEGKGGNDTFKFGGNFTAADSIAGYEGDDTLELNGDYSAGVTLSDSVINALHNVHLDSGHSYDLAVSGDIVTNVFNEIFALTVNAAALGAGDTLTLDLSAATVKGGYAITGGAGDDAVTFAGNFAASDTFDGGAGNDTLELNGDYSAGLTFGAATLTSVETLKLDDGYGYKLITNDGNVASGATMTVDASALTGTNTLNFDGSGEADGNFDFKFAGNFIATDSLTGGAGNDTLLLNGDYSAGVTFDAATIANIETISLAGGHSYTLQTNDANVAAGATMTIDAGALGGSDQLFFDGTAETDGHFAFIAGAGDDVITGGKLFDSFDLGNSNGAFLSGFDGNDTFTATSAAPVLNDSIDGGTGTDTLILNGDFSTPTLITHANLTSIETLQLLGAANSYSLTWADAITTALTVDASAAGQLTFSGAGDTTTAFTVTGSAGDDTITGGGQADILTGGFGADTLTGNGGGDLFVYNAATDSNTNALDSITDFTHGSDKFELNTGMFWSGEFSTNVALGSLDADLASAFASNGGGAASGYVFDFTGADFNGHSYLVVDSNGNGAYDGGVDLVIEITGHVGTISSGDFI